LIILFFLVTWWIAYKILHATVGTWKRGLGAILMSVLYFALVCNFIPWNPYWIRELHVMVWVVTCWKLLDLAFLREGEVLGQPWIDFIGYDAISLRPALRPFKVKHPHSLGQHKVIYAVCSQTPVLRPELHHSRGKCMGLHAKA
jgi:hypothetical protein